MNKYTLLKVLLFSLPLLGLLSCFSKNEPAPFERPVTCPDILNIGTFEMDENSVNFIPYSEPAKRIVFSDADGVEYHAEISDYDFSFQSDLSGPKICEEDAGFFFFSNSLEETKYLEASITALDLRIRFQLAVDVDVNRDPRIDNDELFQSDHLIIFLTAIENFTPPSSTLDIVVNGRNTPDLIAELPTSEFYTIHDKEFENVYHRSEIIPEGEFNIFYNAQFGLIGLENDDQSISLKYERVEY